MTFSFVSGRKTKQEERRRINFTYSVDLPTADSLGRSRKRAAGYLITEDKTGSPSIQMPFQ